MMCKGRPLAAILLLGLAGCATYQPPELKYGETAIIQGQYEYGASGSKEVVIKKIDGLPVDSERNGVVVLSAGCHAIDVSFAIPDGFRGKRQGNSTLSFSAVGGATYVVRAGVSETSTSIPQGEPINFGLFQIWIENNTTHRRVPISCTSPP